jgi:hypothetical protein
MVKGDRFQRFTRSEASVWTTRLCSGLKHYADMLCRLCALGWDWRAGCLERGPGRLCVQERLMCSAGDRPAGVTIGSPVAGRAGRRETAGPEAPRQPHLCNEGKLSGRNESEREVAPKVLSPGGRACNRKGEGCTARRKPIEVTGRSGGVVSDGTTTRTHRATGETLLVSTRKGGSWVGRITGSTGKSADDKRVADGLVVAWRRSNVRGAKEPCCSTFFQQHGRQGRDDKDAY